MASLEHERERADRFWNGSGPSRCQHSRYIINTDIQLTNCPRVILVSLTGWNRGEKRETDQMDCTATPAARLLKQNHLTDTNQGCYCSHPGLGEHPACPSLGAGGFRPQSGDLPFHSLLVMHFSLLIKKLVESDGRKNVQGEYWAHHAYYYISQGITETKRQSLFLSK